MRWSDYWISSKCLSSGERRYNNIKTDALGILHGLENSHDYCFVGDVSIVTGHELLVANLNKDKDHITKMILLRIYQYIIRKVYEPRQGLSKADCLSWQNHTKDKDGEIPGLKPGINAVCTMTEILACICIQDILLAKHQNDHLQQLNEYVVRGLPVSRNKISQEMMPYLTLRDNLSMIDGILLKGRNAIMAEELQLQRLEQLNSNHMGIKTKDY